MKGSIFSGRFGMFLLYGALVIALAVYLPQSVYAATNWYISQSSTEQQDGGAQPNAFTAIQYPLDLIHSTNWKLTLPINSAQEIKVGGNPDLSTYASEWFQLNAAKDGVVFKVRTDGATTSGSKNPRSELREMTSGGQANASWSSSSGVHSMEVEFAVNTLPIGSKPQVVTGQIHDASDDITVFRVEGSLTNRSIASIWITDGNTTHGHLLTDAYRLGDKYRVGFIVSNGQIHYTFNGQPVAYAQSKSFSGAYFKAGSYNQSGGICTKLADGQCDYAEVTVYAAQVCHDGNCTGNAPGNSTPTATPVVPTNTPKPTPTLVVPTNTPKPTPTSTGQPSGGPTATPTTGPTPEPTMQPNDLVIYVSSTSDGKINNASFKDEDVMAYNTANDQWQLYFDGSDVGISGADIDAFAPLPDGSLLFSFNTATKVPGIGKVDDSDIVRFVPTSLGSNTAGTFQLYFVGAKVGLTGDGEDIDALAVLKDGRLIISTTGHYEVGNLSGDGSDLLAFTPSQLGADTAGAWSSYLKATDMGLQKGKQNISGVWFDETAADGVHLYLSAAGSYAGTSLNGDGNDIFTCLIGPRTPCVLQRFWNGNDHKFGGETIDALAMTTGFVDAGIIQAADASEDDGGAADDMEPANELAARDEYQAAYQIFLPAVNK